MPNVIKTGMVVGTAKACVWSQVATQDVLGGTVLALVNLVHSGESDVLDVSAIGAEVLESLKNQLGSSQIDIAKMKELVSKLVEEMGGELELSIVGARIKNNRLIIAGIGGVEVQMKRGGKVGQIFSGDQIVKAVVGEVEKGDSFILSTKELVEVVGQSLLEQSMDETSKLEQLAVVVHGQENSSMLASVIGRVEGGMENETPELQGEAKIVKKRDFSILKKLGRLTKSPLKIRQEQKKQNMTVGMILLVLLVVGVGVGVVRRSRVIKEGEYSKLEAVVNSKLQEASSIADLNPERAKDLLSQVDGEIESYLLTAQDEEYLIRARELARMVEGAKQEVFRQEQVETKTLIELSVLGIESTDIMVGDKNGSLVLADSAKQRLVGVSVEDRSSWEVELASSDQVRAVGVYDQRVYVVTSNGVDEVDLDGEGQSRVIEPEDLWGEVVGIGMFGGNAYLLDTGQGEIWKYPRITEGFGARRRWLGAGIVLDLSNVVDMKVDGDIWIVTSTGKLERYSRGVPVTFEMEGFPSVEGGKLMSPRAIETTEDMVYVLETGANRVVVFELESGRYVKQLVSEEFSTGKRMVVIDTKGYVLTSDKVIEFGL